MEDLKTIMPWIFAVATLMYSFIALRTNSKNSDLDRRKVVLSGNRQEWINNLRNLLSEILAEHTLLSQAFQHNRKDDVLSSKNRIILLKWKIELLLNPTEEDSKLLLKKLLELPSFIKSDYELINKQGEVVEVASRILKSEWERVKRLE